LSDATPGGQEEGGVTVVPPMTMPASTAFPLEGVASRLRDADLSILDNYMRLAEADLLLVEDACRSSRGRNRRIQVLEDRVQELERAAMFSRQTSPTADAAIEIPVSQLVNPPPTPPPQGPPPPTPTTAPAAVAAPAAAAPLAPAPLAPLLRGTNSLVAAATCGQQVAPHQYQGSIVPRIRLPLRVPHM